MTKKSLVLLLALLLQVPFSVATAQAGPASGVNAAATSASIDQLTQDIDMKQVVKAFSLTVNKMDDEKLDKLNRTAAAYRSSTRGLGTDIANAMLQGGVTGIVNVVGNEIVNLIQIRSKQKREWLTMRQRECLFIDTLQSVAGQSDFYKQQSAYGPLDPSNMQFDGITLRAFRDGQEFFTMVSHLDTTRLDHLFLHSKFYLVLDSLVFKPYQSFLPNLGINTLTPDQFNALTKDEKDYWQTISHFDFGEQQSPVVKVQFEVYSSWINEMVQVFSDVKLGTFTVEFPIAENQLVDSTYVYSRRAALESGRPVIDISGDCFVIPRSYMPVSFDRPSWGTGEYKLRGVFSQSCRYNPKGMRAQNWHRDYKQLKKMMNHGKDQNEYLNEVVTTFRDNRFAILKATYQPALNKGGSLVKIKSGR